MFFYLSKLVWFVLQPSAVLVGLVVIAALAGFTRFRRTSRVALILAATGLFIAGFSPFSSALYLPLEERFARVEPRSDVAGIIVLGGVFDSDTAEARGTTEFNEAAERITEVIVLARRYPGARIFFTGGSARLFTKGMTEAEGARRYFRSVGLDPARIFYDDQSRNTYENAIYTKALASPKPGETWLLVTSAFHMPRAVGCFRQVGMEVTPWPVDFRTAGWSSLKSVMRSPAQGLQRTDKAFKEWVGLIAYRLTGRIPSFFPAPDDGNG
ncbi:MAG: YdcF family protein [Hyphomicrobiales bacterium]|nr:YdcF family protein [Hyphomicrobiales bacterium]